MREKVAVWINGETVTPTGLTLRNSLRDGGSLHVSGINAMRFRPGDRIYLEVDVQTRPLTLLERFRRFLRRWVRRYRPVSRPYIVDSVGRNGELHAVDPLTDLMRSRIPSFEDH